MPSFWTNLTIKNKDPTFYQQIVYTSVKIISVRSQKPPRKTVSCRNSWRVSYTYVPNTISN